MPYIKEEDRKRFNDLPQDINTAGELNYVISQMIASYLKKKGLRYENINEVIGVLECAKQEFYRRIVGPYEDQKIKENGDTAYSDFH